MRGLLISRGERNERERILCRGNKRGISSPSPRSALDTGQGEPKKEQESSHNTVNKGKIPGAGEAHLARIRED